MHVNDYGKIEAYGYLHFLDFKRSRDGKTIVFGEAYTNELNPDILDVFIFEFDIEMKLVKFKKIEKTPNKISCSKNLAWGNSLENNFKAFDYMYSQKVNDNDFIFFYSDNVNKGIKARKNPIWSLGIITYVDGVIEEQKIDLKTKNGDIYPIKAKSGSIILKEIEGENIEYRLEKINY